ncbi:proton myo-inositol cotransporter-like [Schistocerca serialis cubense]|uniref:proton myo-inositol cotransporter-like n=1 Tax=Schistocerca serialis cubense TaxID=2023355 RepID=UPI00214E64B9|nr:proton myo-inositol cotransporter-like [Schistocerca serialis cubense]
MSGYEASTNVANNGDFLEVSSERSSKYIYVLTFLSAIGGFLFGYDTGVVSGAMLLIRKELALTTAWHEAIVSATIAAAWVFALMGGWLTDRLGRKPVILVASFVFTAGSVIMGIAPGKELLLIGRIIVGIGIGLASMSVPVYIAESAVPSKRGRMVTTNSLFITGGQFLAAVLCGAFSKTYEGWRYMLGLAAIPACIQFFGFLGMPESPRWLVSKKRYDDALKVLSSIRGDRAVASDELELIKASCLEDEELQQAKQAGSGQSAFVKILRTSHTRHALILGCALQAFQQLSGINTVMYYSGSIIQMAGVKDLSLVIWLAAATASVNFLCTFIGFYLVEVSGRRPLSLWSQAGVVLALIILGVSFHLMALDSPGISSPFDAQEGPCSAAETCASCVDQLAGCGFCYWDLDVATNGTCLPVNPEGEALVGLCSNMTSTLVDDGLTLAVGWCPSRYSALAVASLGIYLLFFAPGMGTMPWTINSEIYPTWARSFCNSFATSTNYGCNLIVSMTFLTLTEVLTKEGTFYLYAGIALLGLVILFFILPETKGKSLEEMGQLFSGPWCARMKKENAKNVQNSKITENASSKL